MKRRAVVVLALGLAVSSFTLARALSRRHDDAWPAESARLQPLTPRFDPGFGKRRVAIDPGHGAPGNSGNRSAFCRDEQDFTLSLAEDLSRALTRTGHFEVLQTRSGGVPVESRAFMAEHLYRIKLDTVFGMLFSNLIAFCVMLATAITLNGHGITEIQTTRDAALALRPIAGDFAFALFALGVIGTGMLAVPVLAGSAAYAVSEVFGWKAGLSHGFHEARGFYAIIIAATGIGTLMSVFELDPIKALVWSAIVNGVISVPIMVVMMWIGQSARLMGAHTISLRHRFFGWGATVVMALAVGVMLVAG